MDQLSLSPLDTLRALSANELRSCNDVTLRFGLYLSEQQILNLTAKQMETLVDTGRIELGGGFLTMLVLAFCDSPYIHQNNYERTLMALLEIFYTCKGESMDRLADDDLIAFMKERFDGICQGSLECLCDAVLWDLCHSAKNDDG